MYRLGTVPYHFCVKEDVPNFPFVGICDPSLECPLLGTVPSLSSRNPSTEATPVVSTGGAWSKQVRELGRSDEWNVDDGNMLKQISL